MFNRSVSFVVAGAAGAANLSAASAPSPLYPVYQGLWALPLYVVGSVIAGFGFGAAFRYVVNALGDAAPADQRGQVFATMYIVSYIAFSIPALFAGLAVERIGLQPTAVAYGVLEILLILTATIAGVTRARRQIAERTPRLRAATN